MLLLTDRIFEKCSAVADMRIQNLLRPVQMPERHIVKVRCRIRPHIINPAN